MIVIELTGEAAKKAACRHILAAQDGQFVRIQDATRTLEQNAKLHACISDVARQVKWGGENLGLDDWKRLLTAAWSRAEKQMVRLIPSIDGNGFDVLYQRTSRMTKPEMINLIEYIHAWGTSQGVQWSDIQNGESYESY